MSDFSDRTTVVVGASRGLGRGVALAFDAPGAPVVAIPRSAAAPDGLDGHGGNVPTEPADATDAAVAWDVVDRYRPQILVLVAGAIPVMRPLHHQTWET